MLKATTIESLPDEIILDILFRLPAQDINSIKHVFPKWYSMTRKNDFVQTHLRKSTPGLLILQEPVCRWDQPIFFAAPEGRIEISHFHYNFKRTVLSSCNGLLLERHFNDRDLYITNPATKQRFALPRFPTTTRPSRCCAIAYVATTKEYKVVASFSHSDNFECMIMILTVGVDTGWDRRVSIQDLPLEAKKLLRGDTLTTEGFVHWTRDYNDILTLNVETEVITQFRVPNSCHVGDDGKRLRYYYLAMGSYLSLLIAKSYLSWEVWEMRPENGEWTRMPDIDVEARNVLRHLSSKLKHSRTTNCWLEPVGWLNSREVLMFHVDLDIPNPERFLIAYNVRTREIDSFELYYRFLTSYFMAHRNSMVWFG
ncbi:hypothetical protein CASFOL_041236 [Castilleja foliolosa]|uniref:F-box domain-containing protein n=1 Tax=Castilleja foliolosa TaxID=1961234 RepID=A0ABD3BDW1_9LAMI